MIRRFLSWLINRSRAEARQRVILRRNYKPNIKLVQTQEA